MAPVVGLGKGRVDAECETWGTVTGSSGASIPRWEGDGEEGIAAGVQTYILSSMLDPITTNRG